MRTARLLGVSDDGRSLIVVTETGEHLAIVADARLRAAVRGDRPRLGQLEIEMESALRPREIQTRIRAGQSLEQVAQAAGVPLERVEPYAAPVLAEREHVAALAMRSSVRRRGETSGHRNLKITVDEKLTARGIDTTGVRWDSARTEDGRWAVTAAYTSGEAPHEAVFLFDVAGRYSVGGNEESRWLLGEQSVAKGPQPGRRRPVREEGDQELVGTEPTLDLSDELALVRAIQDDSPGAPTDPAVGVPTAGPTMEETADADVEVDTDDEAETRGADMAVQVVERVEVIELVEVVELGQEADETDLGQDLRTGVGTGADDEVVDGPPPEQTVLDEFVAGGAEGPAVPEQTELDTLYAMLEGYTEDSVRIYRGLDDHPVTDDAPAPVAEAAPVVEPAPVVEAAPENGAAAWEPEIVVNEPTGRTGLDVEMDDPPSDDTSDEEEGVREGIVEPPTKNPDPIDPSKIPNTTGDPDAPDKEDAVPDAPGAPEPRDPDGVIDQAEDQPLPIDAPAPAKPAPKKRKRASVPSWDEIMFGGPKQG